MNDIVYTNAQIAEILAESKWKLLNGKAPGRVGGNVLQRWIEHKIGAFTHASWQKMELFVATWTSAANYVNDSSAASNTVTNPTVEEGKSVEAGVWYRGPLERKRLAADHTGGPERWHIIQTLFKGAGDTESFFTAEDGCQYQITRKFYVDQVTIPTIPAKSSGVETANHFQLDPEKGFYNGYQEIKSRLYQQVPQFYTMQDAFEKAQRTKHLGVRTGDKDESGAAISPAIPDPTAQAAGVLVQVDRSKNTDCTQDINVETKTAIAQASAGAVDRKDFFETLATVEARNAAAAPTPPAQANGVIVTTQDTLNPFSKHDTKIETRTAVAKTDAQLAKTYTAFEVRAEDTDRNTVLAATLPVSQDAGVIKTVDDVTNDFGRHDIKTVERTAVTQANAGASDTRDTFEAQTVVKAVNATEALTPAAQTPGTIVTAESELNEFLRYDTNLKTRTSVPVASAVEAKQYSAFESRVDVVDRNTVADPTLPSSQDAGTIVNKQDTVNDFGVHDIQTTTRTAIEQAAAGASDTRTPFETVVVAEARNAAEAVTPVAQVAGTIKTVKDSLNDFLKHDTSVETRTAVPVVAAVESKVYTPFEFKVTTVDRHTVIDPTLPSAQSAGTIVEMEDRVTDFNDHDVITTTRTAIAATAGTTKENSYYQTDVTTDKRNQTTEEAEVTFAQGAIATVKNTLNDAARYDTEKRVITGVARSQDAYVASKDEFTQRTVTNLRNQTSAPAAAAVGETVDIDVNNMQLFDSTRVAETPVSGLLDAGGAAHAVWPEFGDFYYQDNYTAVHLTSPIRPYGVDIYHYTYLSSTTVYQIKKTHTVRYWATEAEAVAVLNALSSGTNYEGSYYARVAPGLWKSEVVARADVNLGTTATYTDPYSELH